MNTEKKRVLIVDDSVFARRVLTDILDSSPYLDVVGTAVNGIDALAKVEALKPDVVTMDIGMPKLDGIETLRQLMISQPTRVVMVSSLIHDGAKESVLALKLGAIDVMAKPHGTHSIGIAAQHNELIEKVIAAAHVNVEHLSPLSTSASRPKLPLISHTRDHFPIVIIASSTGGPRALRMLIPALGDISGAAYVLVQHLPAGFSKTMADDLNALTSLSVREASSEGETLRPGEVLFAKSGYHLVFNRNRSAGLALSPPLWGVRPSADVTMVSAAPVFGARIVGVVLTGMGSDGAAGLRAIKEQGGTTIAEHESTCVVYGMPRVAIESGVVDVIAPIDRMAEAINAAAARTAQNMAA
jgi:two-component system, chemotaxis family, protein-glutamate methylesterase/glutaminase